MLFWSRSNIISKSLRYYDFFVNEINCKFVWNCHKENIEKLYKKNIRKNHLEIGPGTGYFIKNYKFNNLTLVDINDDILKYNLKQQPLTKYIRQNLFIKDEKINLLNYSSVGVNCVLHCVPGKLEDKMNNLIQSFNDKDIIIFGGTVVNDPSNNYFTNIQLKILNKYGIFHNKNDYTENLIHFLKKNNYNYNIRKIGQMILFEIRLK